MSRRTPRKRGRPRVLTPERMDEIITLTEQGNALDIASHAVGIDPTTTWKWIARARDARDDATIPDPETGLTTPVPDDMAVYVQFVERLERARAKSETFLVGIVHKVAEGGSIVEETTRVLPDGSEETTVKRTPPDGRLALEVLSRRSPERWGKAAVPQQVEITMPGGAAAAGEVSSSVTTLVERLTGVMGALPAGSSGAGEPEIAADGRDDEPVDAEIVE